MQPRPTNLRQIFSRKTSVQRSIDMTARSGFLFTTIAAVSFLTIAATSSVVLAQQGAVAACAPDIQAQCAPHTNEGRRACIKTRFKDFSLPCQLALVKARAVSKACRADVKKNCADIKPGMAVSKPDKTICGYEGLPNEVISQRGLIETLLTGFYKVRVSDSPDRSVLPCEKLRNHHFHFYVPMPRDGAITLQRSKIGKLARAVRPL